jgi:DNA-binding MarR family transcriptional regulator
MPIPKYTHQQWAVLNALLNGGELWGRDLRAALKSEGYGSTNAAFYELIDRLETAGLVEGRYQERHVLGQLFRERMYKLTAFGHEAWHNVANYYTSRLLGSASRPSSAKTELSIRRGTKRTDLMDE